jgi:hypothetical protein
MGQIVHAHVRYEVVVTFNRDGGGYYTATLSQPGDDIIMVGKGITPRLAIIDALTLA